MGGATVRNEPADGADHETGPGNAMAFGGEFGETGEPLGSVGEDGHQVGSLGDRARGATRPATKAHPFPLFAGERATRRAGPGWPRRGWPP